MKKAISYQPLAISHKLFNEAKKYLVGGVNSPVRSFKAVGGYPVFIRQAKGSKIYAEDEQEYIDYCMSWGSLILGHIFPQVKQELKKAVERGFSFGTVTALETRLAKLITEAIPSIERLRLTNSGTEAVMSAVRLACAFTKRNKIIKFKGGYHGHSDYLFSKYALVAPYNDIKKVKEMMRQHKDIAAVIIEPVAANMGVVLPQDGFLEELRAITQKYGIVLIFDEVITGFRLNFGGAQKLFGVRPDLTCLGKIIGGGLPVGAFGGRYEIMKLLSPEGNVYQAGTFSGNPLTVTAGMSTLSILSGLNPYKRLEEMTKYLCEGIINRVRGYGLKIKVNFIGSMFSISFQEKDLFKRFYHKLLKEGVYFSPSHLETNFVSLAHTVKDIEKTLKAVDKALQKET